MTKIFPPGPLNSLLVQKEWKLPVEYGACEYGNFWYGGLDFSSGIYQIRGSKEGKFSTKIDFYNYVITHTPAQQARREKFDLAVAGWQGLTPEEKEVYNKKSIGKGMSGYNLFLREYMLS